MRVQITPSASPTHVDVELATFDELSEVRQRQAVQDVFMHIATGLAEGKITPREDGDFARVYNEAREEMERLKTPWFFLEALLDKKIEHHSAGLIPVRKLIILDAINIARNTIFVKAHDVNLANVDAWDDEQPVDETITATLAEEVTGNFVHSNPPS